MNRAVLCAASLATILAGTVAACSDRTTAGPGPELDSGPPAPGVEAPDAVASITPRPDLCQGLSRGGAVVPEMDLAGDPPAALGGTVIAGTYDLTELDVYEGQLDTEDAGPHGPSYPRMTGKAAQATMVVSEFAIRTVEARGTAPDGPLSAERTYAVLFRVDGTSLVETPVCPSTEAPVEVSFSAVGGGLAIFTDSRHRELYLRR